MPKQSLDLTGKWEFKEYPLSAMRMRDLDSTGWMQISITSSIFTSLIEAGRIKQADIDTNPEKFTWLSEKTWNLKLKADALAKDVKISTDIPAKFSGNVIDLMPPEEFVIKIACKNHAPLLEPTLKLCSLASVFKTTAAAIP